MISSWWYKRFKKEVIRTVGKPEERFDEDPLRKLRALRFETRLGGSLDKETLDALQKDNINNTTFI